jgi:ABC-type multidrug transport system fused ATPase/permease subunit
MFVRKFLSPYKILNDVISENNMRKPLSDIMFDYVELRDVDYSYIRYDEQGASDIHIKIPAFKVSKGDIICVHGESGQGKTTLLHLLSNEIENDNVWINGCNETTKRIDCVFISQDTEVFDMSLRDNLALGKPVSDDVLKEYLGIVGMGDRLRAQEKGLDTLLGERGVFVSTGQRQRINLIRGLLIKDKEIYLLDEPTSNVDDETEEKMIELINRVLHGKTAVIVTHRPNIQKICNHSYLFKNGVLSKER